jgi:hypothetical protein
MVDREYVRALKSLGSWHKPYEWNPIIDNTALRRSLDD